MDHKLISVLARMFILNYYGRDTAGIYGKHSGNGYHHTIIAWPEYESVTFHETNLSVADARKLDPTALFRASKETLRLYFDMAQPIIDAYMADATSQYSYFANSED